MLLQKLKISKLKNADINAEIALLAATYGTTPQEVSKIIKKEPQHW